MGPKGETKWNYSLKDVYLIGIMDFCFDDSEPQSCLHHVQLTYQSTQEVFYNKLEYIFVEIPKFNKTEIELQTELDCWLFVLKHMNHLQKIPVYLNKGIFKKLFKLAEIANLSKEEYMNYHDRVLIAQWDEYAQKEWLEEEAMKKGMEKGMEKGIKMAATSLLLNGFTITQTAKLLGVTENFVQLAQSEMK
jgi:predicted transposase/invertase (TIGR01784 family)